MIVAAGFVPGSPLLVPVAGAAPADDAVAALRAASEAVTVALAAARPEALVVVGTGPRYLLYSPVAEGSLVGFGLDVAVHLGSPACGAVDPLPTSLTLGAWLLRERFGPSSGAVGVGCAATEDPRTAAALPGLLAGPRVAVLVVADGAERFPPLDGPGHDARRIGAAGAAAEACDDVLAGALATGDGDTLATTGPPAGDLVSLSSWPAWRAAGRMLAGPGVTGEVLLREARHGVGWLAAVWRIDD